MTAAEAKTKTQNKINAFNKTEEEKKIIKDKKDKEIAKKNRKKQLKNTLEHIKEEIDKNQFSTFIFCSYNGQCYSDQFLKQDLEKLGYRISYEIYNFSDDDRGSPIMNISWE